MYRKIIVGYDGSERSQDGLALGKLIAEASGADLVVAGVFEFDRRWGGVDPYLQEAEADHAREIERAAAAVGAEAEAIPSSSPGRGLHELAEEIGADLVVVGSSHRSRAGQVLAGNVGTALLHGSPCSVAIAPHGYATGSDPQLAEIVVAYDGSPEAQMALEDAIALARPSEALLKLVTVAEPPVISYGKGGGSSQGWQTLKETVEAMMRDGLEQATASIPDDVRLESVLVNDEPATALAQIARNDGALLMLGSRAYGPLRRVLLGSVATKLARTAPCPLIVHPRPAKSAAPAEERVTEGAAR
ncbi:MAG TPA: universal stress protein [Thermoleophilaceae bacterium]|nr:universal stress protein [Thermoleophilaceae bacterium]